MCGCGRSAAPMCGCGRSAAPMCGWAMCGWAMCGTLRSGATWVCGAGRSKPDPCCIASRCACGGRSFRSTIAPEGCPTSRAAAGWNSPPAARAAITPRPLNEVGLSVAATRGQVDVLALHGGRLKVTLVLSRELPRVGVGDDNAVATVEAHVTEVVDHHGPVVDVRHVDVGNVRDCAVVHHMAAAPESACVTNTGVAKPVVHTAIEADVRAPVTGMPEIGSASPAPVAGGPQKTGTRREYPGSGHPVVTIITPSPVSGCPDVVGARRSRLHIDRQGRRGDVDRDADRNAGEGGHGKRGEHEGRSETANEAIEHWSPLQVASTGCSVSAECVLNTPGVASDTAQLLSLQYL